MNRLHSLVLVLALAACAQSEEASLVPPEEDEGYNLVRPVEDNLPTEADPAVGEWALSRQEDRPALQFGPPATEPLFSLRCDQGGAILIQRHGVIAGPGMNMMQIESGGAARRVAVSPAEGPLPMLRGALPSNSDLARDLQASSERITVRIGDGEALVLPPSPLLGAFIADCSEAEDDAAGGGQAAPADVNQATPSARTPQ